MTRQNRQDQEQVMETHLSVGIWAGIFHCTFHPFAKHKPAVLHRDGSTRPIMERIESSYQTTRHHVIACTACCVGGSLNSIVTRKKRICLIAVFFHDINLVANASSRHKRSRPLNLSRGRRHWFDSLLRDVSRLVRYKLPPSIQLDINIGKPPRTL